MLLAETPFVPVYTYVTKRMVNPRLKGWQSNVMDHHYSKNMFFLKAVSDESTVAVVEETEQTTEGEQERAVSGVLEEIPVFGDGHEPVGPADQALPESDEADPEDPIE